MPNIEDGPVGQKGLMVGRPLTDGSLLGVWEGALGKRLNNSQRRYFEGMGPPCLHLLSYLESRVLLGGVATRASDVGGNLLQAIPGLSDPYPDPLQVIGARLKTTEGGRQYLYAKVSLVAGEHDSLPVVEKNAIYKECSSMDGARPSRPKHPPAVLLASIGSKSLVHGAMQWLYRHLDEHFKGQDGERRVEEGMFGAAYTVPAAVVSPPGATPAKG